jgi:carbonic anhydrase
MAKNMNAVEISSATEYGVSLVETDQVWNPGIDTTRVAVTSPPLDLAGFVEPGNTLVKSDRIASLIGAQGV